jgi:hypothetical protein
MTQTYIHNDNGWITMTTPTRDCGDEISRVHVYCYEPSGDGRLYKGTIDRDDINSEHEELENEKLLTDLLMDLPFLSDDVEVGYLDAIYTTKIGRRKIELTIHMHEDDDDDEDNPTCSIIKAILMMRRKEMRTKTDEHKAALAEINELKRRLANAQDDKSARPTKIGKASP